ncbi:MAG: glucosyl-3-phosphoglycerate synthase [Solirubrobacterales bacterium]
MQLIRQIDEQGRLAVFVRQLYELLRARATFDRGTARDQVLPAAAYHAPNSTLAEVSMGRMQQQEGEQNVAAASQRAAFDRARAWTTTNCFSAELFSADDVPERPTISVVIPAKQVAGTIALVVDECVALREAGAVDEVVVVDAGSTDGTGRLAAAAGARVEDEADLMPGVGDVLGKGDAMWRSLSATTSEIVVFVDGDTEGFDRQFVVGLAGPLVADHRLQLVKGAFSRPYVSGSLRVEGGGGRVNELMARPLLNIFFPELAAVRQPLAGEFAAHRSALEALSFCTGYGTEIQLLVDTYLKFGLDAIAQCDLGERINQHQSLASLGPMAFAVARALLSRVERLDFELSPDGDEFLALAGSRHDLTTVPLVERPPVSSLVKVNDGA